MDLLQQFFLSKWSDWLYFVRLFYIFWKDCRLFMTTHTKVAVSFWWIFQSGFRKSDLRWREYYSRIIPQNLFQAPSMKTKASQRFCLSGSVNIASICVKPRLTPRLAILAIQLHKYLLCSLSAPRDLLRACSSCSPCNYDSRLDSLPIMTRIMESYKQPRLKNLMWVNDAVWPCRLQNSFFLQMQHM